MSDIRSFVDTIFDELVSIRRDIHAHPELGMHEVRTSALIRSELEKMGVDEIQQPLPTAVVALIHGKKGPGKCVALRADIDALPVTEQTGEEFARKPVCPLPARPRALCTPAVTTCTPPCFWAPQRRCAICATSSPAPSS